MTTTQQGVLAMIKSAITGISDPLPEDFRLEPAMQLMFSQGLGAMCFLAAQNYGFDPNSETMLYLRDQYCFSCLRSEQQLMQIDRICQAFEQHGIAYMPVKGSIIKKRYPDHAMRNMCDADILIHDEEYDRIRPVMESLHFTETKESDHEHIWKIKGLTVELHKRLIPSYNKDYYSYFGEGWDLAKVNEGGCRWAMVPEDAFIYDTIHFAKHYRDASANAHFLIDLWIHRRCFPDMDQAYIRQQMTRLRMEGFYDNILHVISAWFENGPWDDKAERITGVLLNENLREQKDNKIIAKNTRAVQASGSVRKAKKNLFWQRIFPSKETMGYAYPQWKKVPLPIAWVLRWFYLLFCRGDALEKLKAPENRIDQQKVENYRQDLEYIGLQFSDQVVLPD